MNHEGILVSIYLLIHYYYYMIYQKIMKMIGPISFIYLFDGKNQNNITLRRYLSYYFPQLWPHASGIICVKIFDGDECKQIAYQGDTEHLDDLLENVKEEFSDEEITQKRNNVMFLNNNNAISFDLNVLDSYNRILNRINWRKNGHTCSPIRILDVISKLFNIDATHVQIIRKFPLKKDIYPINRVTLDMIYSQ
jgi:hypothetical protein